MTSETLESMLNNGGAAYIDIEDLGYESWEELLEEVGAYDE